MFAAVKPILAFVAVAAIYVRADPNPNRPSPGDIFVQGTSCSIGWDVDPTGLWKTMQIDLMTGDNYDMAFLTTVGTVDGTNPSTTTFSYPCPQVSPHSPIYFYQFTSPSTTNKAWTGRFTITDSVNDVVAPSSPTQPDGENIPWGTGSLVNTSSPAAPSASGSQPSHVGSSTGGTLTTLSAPSVTPELPSLSAPTSYTSTPSVGDLTSGASTTPGTVSGTGLGVNGAVTMLSVSNILIQTALGLGLAAVGFTVVF